jgi:hypothetical protein
MCSWVCRFYAENAERLLAPESIKSDRQARRVVAALAERRVLTSESPRSPLHIAFPAELASRWMPGLFPGRTA